MHHPEKTAMTRKTPSAPLLKIIESDLLKGDILDYGCGKGTDVFYLEAKGYFVCSWDPNFILTTDSYQKKENACPWRKPSFDTIICTYVLNVLPPTERKKVIQHVLSILKPGGRAIFSVRGPKDRSSIKGNPYKDGFITKKGTFQRSFTAKELKKQIPGSTILFDEGGFVSVTVVIL